MVLWGTNGRMRRLVAIVTVACVCFAAPAWAAPAARSATAGGATITGTVTRADTATAVAGAWVVVMRSGDLKMEAEARADATGAFSASVSAGSYVVYLIDPSGASNPGFNGAPDVVSVGTGGTATVNATMRLTTGAITGTVRDASSSAAISSAWVIALNSRTGAAEAATKADAQGRFTMSGLRAGSHYLSFLDPAARHSVTYYPGVRDFASATAVTVSAGAMVTANVGMAAQSGSFGMTSLRGTVTEDGSGVAVSGAVVLALRSSDFAFFGASQADSRGQYRLSLPQGSYRLAFLDPTGGHQMEWYADQPYSNLAGSTSVPSPGTTNASLVSSTGTMAGTVLDDAGVAGIAGAWVLAIGNDGTVRGAVTEGDGSYVLDGLPVGTYRAAVIDPAGTGALEYWDDHADFDAADTFTVTPSASVPVSAELTSTVDQHPLLDSSVGWWEASAGLSSAGALPDLSGSGHDMTLAAAPTFSYPPALLAPDPGRGRHLFSPGWDDMFFDTPDPSTPITGLDVAWEADPEHVLTVNEGAPVDWMVHQGSSALGTFSWGVGIVAATGQVEVAWSEDGVDVQTMTSQVAFPTGPQRGAVTLDPATGDLTVYRQDIDAPHESFDLPLSDPAWTAIDVVAGTGPVSLFDSAEPIRHSSTVVQDMIGDSPALGWFKALYRLRVDDHPGGTEVAGFDVGLVPDEPVWFQEADLPPLFPGNPSGEASSTQVAGQAGETWTVHNYLTSSYPILIVDRPVVVFGNSAYGSVAVHDPAYGITNGRDFSVWIAYEYPRVGSGGGPFVGAKNWSSTASTPGWMLLSSPYFGGPSAVVSDGTSVAYDPAPPASDSHPNISGFQYDGAAGTIQSYTNGASTASPVSVGGFGPLSDPSASLRISGYNDLGSIGPSFAMIGLAVFDRTLTPAEIDQLPAEFGIG